MNLRREVHFLDFRTRSDRTNIDIREKKRGFFILVILSICKHTSILLNTRHDKYICVGV